jgi:hypothetical protein
VCETPEEMNRAVWARLRAQPVSRSIPSKLSPEQIRNQPRRRKRPPCREHARSSNPPLAAPSRDGSRRATSAIAGRSGWRTHSPRTTTPRSEWMCRRPRNQSTKAQARTRRSAVISPTNRIPAARACANSIFPVSTPSRSCGCPVNTASGFAAAPNRVRISPRSASTTTAASPVRNSISTRGSSGVLSRSSIFKGRTSQCEQNASLRSAFASSGAPQRPR